MSHDHVGIPKFIEKGFSDKEKVYVYNLMSDKVYQENIQRLGTENNYYEYDVEKELLANGIEKNFSKFYVDFCSERNCESVSSILLNNIDLVTQFFSFMFMRAKKALEIVNKNSLSSLAFGELSHSELLRYQLLIKTNPLKIIGDNYYFYPLFNFSGYPFINNSLGFGVINDKNNNKSFVIPMNNVLAILINSVEYDERCFYQIEKQKIDKTITINKCICKTEAEFGNGFIFGRFKSVINECMDYIKGLKS